MSAYFRDMLIFNSIYMYGARCSIGLLTILDVKQNIFTTINFHSKLQRECYFKIKNEVDLKKITPHQVYGPIFNN